MWALVLRRSSAAYLASTPGAAGSSRSKVSHSRSIAGVWRIK